jgi:hypothetical protein
MRSTELLDFMESLFAFIYSISTLELRDVISVSSGLSISIEVPSMSKPGGSKSIEVPSMSKSGASKLCKILAGLRLLGLGA